MTVTAASFAKACPKDEDGNMLFTVDELDWFRKNSYNLAVTKSQIWPVPQLVRILLTCLTFAERYPSDIPLSDKSEISLMSWRCHFIVAVALVSMARTQNNVEEQLQRYVEMRHHIAAFDASLQTEIATQDEAVVGDLIKKAAALFIFDFEGAVALRSWDELDHIVRKARTCREENVFKAMGDCLLRSQAPGRGTRKLAIAHLEG